MVEVYEKQSLDEISNLLIEDKLTFYVLTNILSYQCQKIITDRKDFIICYSCSPHPVWVWTNSKVSDEIYKCISNIIHNHFKSLDNYYFNMKTELIDYLMKNDKKCEWYVCTKLLAYKCPNIIEPKRKVGGSLAIVSKENYDIARALIRNVFDETTEKRINDKDIDDITKQSIASGNLFFWLNTNDKVVAMCYVDYGMDYGKITFVYTILEERRKGYAAQMIYEVSSIIACKGLLPILYTDGDYNASNECYKGIGFVEQGYLCSVSRK